MTTSITISIPDIGNFESVEVIEVLVKVGDTIAKEDSLITVESDKASMDIPSSDSGRVESIEIKVGDKVKQGTAILVVSTTKTEAKEEAPAIINTKPESPSPAPDVVTTQTNNATDHNDITCDVAVLGSGPGGYTAAFRAADLGKKVVLIERYSTIGGVCLNVGCIPSKALLHTAKVITDAEDTAHHGVTFSEPEIDLDALRDWKSNKVVKKLTMDFHKWPSNERLMS